MRPFGWFVHHQGRGHAERCAALLAALPRRRPVTVFCARDDIFGTLPANVEVRRIPSLFERLGEVPPAMDDVPAPDTLHCAPLGWPGIRQATAAIAGWFAQADPALMVVDVSAEVAQLARICSVPHVKVLQHGERGDPGHRAAYDGAAGLIAPFSAALAQPEWPAAMLARTHFAAGIGTRAPIDRAAARRAIGVPQDARMVLVVSGAGGDGIPVAPLGVGARALPDARWIAIGALREDWHATVPGNLEQRGWVDGAVSYIAAADMVVSAVGNTLCHQILAAGVPWIAVPEWRYFDEQHVKARALARAGAAHVVPHLPSSAQAWRAAAAAAVKGHDPAAQRALVVPHAAEGAAAWLETLAAQLWDRGEAAQIAAE